MKVLTILSATLLFVTTSTPANFHFVHCPIFTLMNSAKAALANNAPNFKRNPPERDCASLERSGVQFRKFF